MASKKGNGEGTIRKRANGSWEARITVGYNPNGTQKRKSIYGKTRQEVQRKMTTTLNEYNNGKYFEPVKMSVAKWLNTWLQDYKANTVKSTTFINYRNRVINHIIPAIGKYNLKDLRAEYVQNLFNEMHKNDYAPETIRGTYNIIHEALKQAVNNDLLIKNIADTVILPADEKKDVRVLSVDEQTRFIDVAKETYTGEVFIMALGTGMRIGELLALMWSDIDFEENTVYVNRTLNIVKDFSDKESKWHKEFGSPKTFSSKRKIPIIPVLQELLKKHRQNQDEIKSRALDAYEDNDLIFATQLGKPLDPRNLQRTLRSIADKANLKNVHAHCLRHTFATRGLENGIELVVMKELLGHSSIKMTADLYTHVLPDKKKEAIAKLNDTIVL
jgi:integrase